MQDFWQKQSQEVIQLWNKLHRRANFRIYEHILIHHGAELLERFPEGIGKHSQQLFERSNGTDILFQYQHTMHRGGRKTDDYTGFDSLSHKHIYDQYKATLGLPYSQLLEELRHLQSEITSTNTSLEVVLKKRSSTAAGLKEKDAKRRKSV